MLKTQTLEFDRTDQRLAPIQRELLSLAGGEARQLSSTLANLDNAGESAFAG